MQLVQHIKIKVKLCPPLISCWFALQITHGPWCVTLWNSRLETNGGAVRMCPHFLPHSSTVEHWVSCLLLWSMMDTYEMRVLLCHCMLETYWTSVKMIFMQKCIKWVKIVLHLKIFELFDRKSFSTGNVLKGLMSNGKISLKFCLENCLNEDIAIYKQECYYFHNMWEWELVN